MQSKTEKNWIEYSDKPSAKAYIMKKLVRFVGREIRKKNLKQVRSLWEAEARRVKPPKNMEISRINIAGVKCEWISPADYKGNKIIIYFHGGGYVLGSVNTARGFAIQLARYCEEKVLTVDYRLAPENPFPAALEDAMLVYHGLLEQDVSPNDIILMGDSAGGGLSLAAVLSLKDINEPLPGAVICLSPWTDLAATGESNKLNAKLDPIFGGGGGVINPRDYAGSEELTNPLISPLYGDYDNFPPILIHVGTDEVILDDSIRLAEKAIEAGVHVSIKVWKGMWHVFTTQGNGLPEARQSLKEIAAFIKEI
jgi:acetyl esterase/lipase